MSLLDPTYQELERQVEELEDCMTANDELMQTMEEIMALQDKMITDLCKEVDEYKSGTVIPPYKRKLVPKPVYTDEDQLNILKSKLKR